VIDREYPLVCLPFLNRRTQKLDVDAQTASQILDLKEVAARQNMSSGKVDHFPFSFFDSPTFLISTCKRRI